MQFGGRTCSGSWRPDKKEGIYLGAELSPDHPHVQAEIPLHGLIYFLRTFLDLKKLSWNGFRKSPNLGISRFRPPFAILETLCLTGATGGLYRPNPHSGHLQRLRLNKVSTNFSELY
ncbi:unnamed protein product [Allacma fusca]|uniref:Uncharacterized protein n=1 Tax=Allacma fusca TaxID=39272 RepID=A0A8J2PB76_9HEXA|nr:unnamed protein product [Allacma fusca]